MANSTENEYSSEATVGDQWQRGETGKFERVLDAVSFSPAELQKRISQLAYQRYLRRGKVHGYELDDWLAAESQVLHRFPDISVELLEQANGEEI
jgi:hypothetical protein